MWWIFLSISFQLNFYCILHERRKFRIEYENVVEVKAEDCFSKSWRLMCFSSKHIFTFNNYLSIIIKVTSAIAYYQLGYV